MFVRIEGDAPGLRTLMSVYVDDVVGVVESGCSRIRVERSLRVVGYLCVCMYVCMYVCVCVQG